MDNSLSLVSSFPYQEQPLPDWTPLACISVMTLVSLLASVSHEEKEEETEETLQEATPPSTKKQKIPQVPGLEEALLTALRAAGAGLRAKDLVGIVRPSVSGVTKKEINSCLYKMLGARKITKSTDTAPIWKLSTLS
jgi:hypothetical protein